MFRCINIQKERRKKREAFIPIVYVLFNFAPVALW
jgi:hypothetical protein